MEPRRIRISVRYLDVYLRGECRTAASPLLTLTGFASLAVSHVVEHIFHGATVGQVALPNFAVGLLPPLALVRVEEENQLLLN